MPRLFQHGKNTAPRPLAIEFNRGNDPFADAMIQVLEKDACLSLPGDRKRIGIEPMSGIRNRLPGRPGQVPALPNPRIIGIPPAYAPMWRITAETIYLQHNRMGHPAQDVCYGLSHDGIGPVGYRRKS